MRNFLMAGVMAIMLAGAANGCSATSSTSNNGPTIGAEGGIVNGPDGSSVSVPPGALAGKTAISIAVAQAGTYPELTFTPLGKVYAFLPHGTVFASPATATLPAPAATGQFDVWTAEQGGTWMKLSTLAAADSKLTFKVSKFSYFAVGPSTAPPGACIGSRVPPARPTATGSGTTKWFAANSMRLGLTKPDTNIADPMAWESYGYDLDDRCTSRDDSKISANSCKRRSGSATFVLRDGALGVDNNFGQHVMSVLKSLKADVEEAGIAGIVAGERTLLLRLDNVGGDNNAKVPGALYLAGALGSTPTFTTSDVWPVDTRSLADGASIDKPTAVFPNGYMAGGVWVSGEIGGGATADVEIPVLGGGLRLKLKEAVVTVQVADGKAGIIAGAVTMPDLESEFGSFARRMGICPGNATYDQIVNTMTQSADVVAGAPKLQDTAKECDMLSVGLGFSLKPTGAPTATKAPPVPPTDECTP